MALTSQFKAEARLFICGYVDIPLSGSNGKIDDAHKPMWALMKTGEIDLNPNVPSILGLRRSSHLSTPFIKKVEHLNLPNPNCLLEIVRRLSTPIKPKVFKEFLQNRCFTRFQSRALGFEVEIFRGAVLVPLKLLRSLSFKCEEGFGVFLTRKDLVSMARPRKTSTRTVMLSRRKAKIVTMLPADIVTSSNGIRGAWSRDIEDIRFLSHALSKWEEESRKERSAQMRKASKIEYSQSS